LPKTEVVGVGFIRIAFVQCIGVNRIAKCFCDFLTSFSKPYPSEDIGVLYEVFFLNKFELKKSSPKNSSHSMHFEC